MKQRWPFILMLACMAGIGTQAAGYLHELDHQWQDAAAGQQSGPGGRGPGEPAAPTHSHDHCATCAALHAPLLGGAPSTDVTWCGAVVAVARPGLTTLAPQDQPRPAACRGPPEIAGL